MLYDSHNQIIIMEQQKELGDVISKIENEVGFITFYHPKSNSLPARLLQKLTNAINDFSQSANVKVIVIQSEGDGAFCAGASFDELLSIQDTETARNFFLGFARVILAMRNAPKFVIARVQGKAVGGGVGIACAADYAIATQSASVKLSELSVGFGPFVIGPVVERRIGITAFQTLSINATDWRSASWAQEKGLFAEVYKDIFELDNAVNKLSIQLAQSNPAAMKELKNIFWQDTRHWEALLEERASISGHLALSEFAVRIMQKFKQG